MLHPPFAHHDGAIYALDHLFRTSRQCRWRASSGLAVVFNATIGYSNHCYTDEKIQPGPASYVVEDRGTQRAFCPLRHAASLGLPRIVDELFAQPTRSVGVLDRNYNCYEMQAGGAYYYLFFSLRRALARDHNLRLYVESAYIRQDPVRSRRKIPFGLLCERIVRDERP